MSRRPPLALAARTWAALLAAAALLLAAPAAAAELAPPPGAPPDSPPEPAPEVSTRLALGAASLSYAGAGGGRVARGGVALELRTRYRRTPAFGVDLTLTWGLTDWDRARQWIDAGNSAGHWTTDRIQAVGDWAMEDEKSRGLRLMAAAFADMFLASTYVAVPTCYLGSVGGATSHLQVDVTATLHPGAGPLDGWLEGGVGVLALPIVLDDWDLAFGPVVGVGLDLGPIRVGARFLWSPPALHGASLVHGTVFSTAATLSIATR